MLRKPIDPDSADLSAVGLIVEQRTCDRHVCVFLPLVLTKLQQRKVTRTIVDYSGLSEEHLRHLDLCAAQLSKLEAPTLCRFLRSCQLEASNSPMPLRFASGHQWPMMRFITFSHFGDAFPRRWTWRSTSGWWVARRWKVRGVGCSEFRLLAVHGLRHGCPPGFHPKNVESLVKARNGRCTAGWELWGVWIGQDLRGLPSWFSDEPGPRWKHRQTFFWTEAIRRHQAIIVWNSTSHFPPEMIRIPQKNWPPGLMLRRKRNCWDPGPSMFGLPQVLKHCNIQGKAGELLGIWLRHMPRLRESETEIFFGHQMTWDDISMDWSKEHEGKPWLLKHFPSNRWQEHAGTLEKGNGTILRDEARTYG